MTWYDDNEAIPLENCPLIPLCELPVFLQELKQLQQDSQGVVIKFLSRVSVIDKEERANDDFLTFILVKHKAIIASIERQLIHWLSLTLTKQEQEAITDCQEILSQMYKAQMVFEDYCPLKNLNYH